MEAHGCDTMKDPLPAKDVDKVLTSSLPEQRAGESGVL
jgi:hypothetical protein